MPVAETEMTAAPTNSRPPMRGHSLLSIGQWRSIAAVLDLSSRELQIIQCLFDGKHEPAIAQALGISEHTVRTHVKRLHRKLGVHDRSELLIRIFSAYIAIQSRPKHTAAPLPR